MAKINQLAEKLTGIATKQLTTSYLFKLPRVNQIRKYRDLYNGKTQRQLRVRYNVPIPFFSGMIDTLQADLDDSIVLKADYLDPADWKACEKFNAALQKEVQSMEPGAMWNEKFRGARQECIMTGRGTLKLTASNEDGFKSTLDDVPFEDFYFEPKGGRNLESHLFCGQANIWKTSSELEENSGIVYDKNQVKRLLDLFAGNAYKQSSYWDNYDYSNRFMSLNLASESNNYVGENMFNLVEWVMTYEGQRWYLLFEAFTSQWIRFEKLEDINQSKLFPWVSFASHPDKKNFASKGFADDLYPIAVSANDLFNEDLENRRRRNSNARAYDKDMFPNVAQLDQAQMGRDRLVETNTKGGTRKIADGIYAFQTPEITGTLEAVSFLEQMAGKNYGVNDIQMGANQPATKKVGVMFTEQANISKRLNYLSQPIVEAGQQLGIRYLGALKDYLKEPLSIRRLGEDGYEWDELKRIDLNTKKGFEITVTSQSKENKTNEMAKAEKAQALADVSVPIQAQDVNAKMIKEARLRSAGFSEAEISLLLDSNAQADKRTIAETSEAIQELMMGKMPKTNYNATSYFLQRILDFVKTHRDDKKVKKNESKFMDYIDQHIQIAQENEQRKASNDAMIMKQKGIMSQGGMPLMQPQGQEAQIPGQMINGGL